MGNAIIGRGGSGDGARVGEVRYSMRNSLGDKWALCNGDPITGGGGTNDLDMEQFHNVLNAGGWKRMIKSRLSNAAVIV